MRPHATYAALWVKSNYSFLEGASHPEELVGKAHELGLGAIAITDRDGVYGLVRAHLEAKKLGLPLVLGAQVTVVPKDECELPADGAIRSEARGNVVLLARDRAGYGSLTRLLSTGRLRSPKGESKVTLEELCGAAGGLVALTRTPAFLEPLRDAYGDDAFALLVRHHTAEDVRDEVELRAAALLARTPIVAGTEVLYHAIERRPLSDVLVCIKHGCTLETAGKRIKPNGEHALKSPTEMNDLFEDDPAALERTLEIAARCTFRLDEIRYVYPGESIPGGEDESSWLRKLTYAGANERYGDSIPGDVRAQLDRELELIEELGYGGYFLTMFEIVRFCREENIFCQGRGSAANSAVCFCLGITAVDPVRMELLFERFLSRERAEPPDIDLDIEHERREEVIQWVYSRYGRRYAAMVANFIRYRSRSAVRDVGKALGIPQTELDGFARVLSHWGDDLDEPSLVQAGYDSRAPSHRLLLELSTQILDFPRHLSIHPGGFLLGHEPVDTLVPIEPATMENRTVIQWDKQDIEDLGLFKVDLLGLGSLTAIHRALDLLRVHEGLDLDMARVPAEDPATYDMCCAGDTVGVFQIESRAQMAMLPRLRPKTFYDLVIEVAIVRPGPIQGDMVHPYLRRRTGQEAVSFPHPALERVLQKTLGVPIFQEQVMKLAIAVAGYTPGEADQLRRDMAAWRSKGRIESHRERILTRMIERGIPSEFAERVFNQIRGFGEYGFPESHAASFALLAYITAWLKCHHPAAFTCAMLNSQPMGFYSPASLVEDAKRHRIEIRPIDVGTSHWDCTLEDGALRMGFRYVKGFGEPEKEKLARAPGPYRSIEDFIRKTKLSKRALVSLAETGAFDAMGEARRDALWKVRGLAPLAHDPLPLAPNESEIRFAPLHAAEEIAWDYQASHHSPRGHPMESLRGVLKRRGHPLAERLRELPDGAHVDYVGVVICRQRPGTKTGVTFMTLEDESGFANIVVWRPVFDRYQLIGRSAVLLGIKGRLQHADGVTHLIADELYLPELALPEDTGPRSRDFH
jgi:error-prone DNA polymerase